MKRKGLVVFGIILVIGLFVFIGSVSAATINAASCSQSAVQSAINSASNGDTVQVPAGTCTWSSQLTISKAITLQGNGIGSTVIRSSQGSSTIMIQYAPSSPQSDGFFRITGFTFDGNQNSIGVEVENPNDAYHIHNIRVDHNRFYHCANAAVVFGNWNGQGRGRISGVVDNNVFDDCIAFTRAYGSYYTSWAQDPLDLGGPTGMYIEDNVMTMSSSYCSAHPAALHTASSGWGGRYVYRFNTITYQNGGWQDGFDVHGMQSCNTATHDGSVSTEIYDNTISYGMSSRFIFDRGGTGFIFDNTLTNAPTLQLTCESYSRPDLSPGPAYCCTSWPCQQMLHSYFWDNLNNHQDLTSPAFTYTSSPSDTQILHENRDYWFHKTSFTGTSGVGVGALSSRPSTCTTGVGYWATDVGEWNSLHSGADGQFYKCTSTNTWTLDYKPYTYPHPLITGGATGDTTPPTIQITSPTTSTTYTTTSSTINLGGTASDDTGVTSVTWVNSRGGSGTASGTTSWTASGITLYSGSNVLTVTSHDASGNTGTDALTVTYNAGPVCGDGSCDSGETCLQDNCCSGAVITGDCCSTSDCSGTDTCVSHVCTAPASTCGDADNNPRDGTVLIGELMNYISSWKSGSVVIGDLMNAIGEWKNGC